MEPALPVHHALMEELEALSRRHLLFFRVQVGRTVAKHLYNSDPARMREQLAAKDGALRDFALANAQALEDRGLSEQLLRQCVGAWAVVVDLPEEVADQLLFAHVVALSGVGDSQTRKHLAQATVDNQWSSRVLADAIAAVRAKRWIDVDLATPGLHPPPAPPPPTPERATTPGRALQRFERSAKEVADAVASFEALKVEQMTRLQRRRAIEALGLVRERMAALELRLRD